MKTRPKPYRDDVIVVSLSAHPLFDGFIDCINISPLQANVASEAARTRSVPLKHSSPPPAPITDEEPAFAPWMRRDLVRIVIVRAVLFCVRV